MPNDTILPAPMSPERAEAYRAMHPSQAWEQAMLAGAAPPEEVQREMGWSVHILRRYLSTERFYPCYEDIPKFCRLVGNEIVIEWLAVQARAADAHHHHAGPLGGFELMERVALIFEASGDVAKKAREAVADRRVTLNELRSIIRVLDLSAASNMRLLGELRSIERELAQGATRRRVDISPPE